MACENIRPIYDCYCGGIYEHADCGQTDDKLDMIFYKDVMRMRCNLCGGQYWYMDSDPQHLYVDDREHKLDVKKFCNIIIKKRDKKMSIKEEGI